MRFLLRLQVLEWFKEHSIGAEGEDVHAECIRGMAESYRITGKPFPSYEIAYSVASDRMVAPRAPFRGCRQEKVINRFAVACNNQPPAALPPTAVPLLRGLRCDKGGSPVQRETLFALLPSSSCNESRESR
jgi:hypothetical protein